MSDAKSGSKNFHLSLKEKLALLSGKGDWFTCALPNRGINSVEMHDGPLGLRKPSIDKAGDNSTYPAIPSTCFPAPCLTACSWDPDLMKAMGECFAHEAIDQKTNIVLAPGVNIKRNPLCGRNFEYLSEDPLLAGKMASGFINGVQSQNVGVSLKHFAGNNQEYRRMTYTAEIDQRALREIYLRPFEIAVKEANPWTIMCSYNRINGHYSAENEWLLEGVLRKEWGYSGCVISDWGAVNSPVISHANGLDIEMPCHENRVPLLCSAVKNDKLSLARINEESSHVIALASKAAKTPLASSYDYSLSHTKALEMAENSIVLAKNDGILPLRSYADCCIIGGFAKTPRYQGAGSSLVNPKHLVSFLDAVKNATKKEIPYAQGYPMSFKEEAEPLLIDAVDLASSHKKVILFLGLPAEYETEGFDRRHMRLPEDQYKLFEAVYAQNKNIIVVLSLGGVVELPFASEAKAILISYLAGEAGGEAVDAILRGQVNPSGHLAESWPIHYADVPSAEFYPGAGDFSLYKESFYVGYRYYLSAKKEVLFPFGHGLSYSKFDYSALTLSRKTVPEGKPIRGSFLLTNHSKKDGAAVVQIYISQSNPITIKPLRELKWFAKIFLKAGKSRKITFVLPYDVFSHYDVTSESFVVEAGHYLIEVGASCTDIRLSQTLMVASDFKPVDERSLLPSYASPSSSSFKISDEEFEMILGHRYQDDALPKTKHFTPNSTFGDISNTFIGRKIKYYMSKLLTNPSVSQETNDAALNMGLDSPIRSMSVMGMSEKKMLALVDLANHRPLRAIYDLCFGSRK